MEFLAYHDALASSDPNVHQLADRASLHNWWKPNSGQGKDVSHVIAQFVSDCRAGTLPAVSWIVAPYAYTEHPVARPVDGAAYVQGVLNALWANPKLAASTVVFHGPNGFVRHARGSVLSPDAGIEARLGLRGGGGTPKLQLTLQNHTGQRQTVEVTGFHRKVDAIDLEPHQVEVQTLNPLADTHGWYELIVSVPRHPLYTRLFAGHLENGRPSRTGPE